MEFLYYSVKKTREPDTPYYSTPRLPLVKLDGQAIQFDLIVILLGVQL